jgi:hypothetical protein
MKHWIELTDEYTKTIKNASYRKIRLQNGQEIRCVWIEYEKCFYYYPGDYGFYMDDPLNRPTHVLVG